MKFPTKNTVTKSPESSQFGGYQIISQLGNGGMGDVYQAKQMGLDRIVALKVLPASMARSPEFSDRFYSEAFAISRLQHQNIVTIYDYGEEGDQRFIAMQFVEGFPLSKLVLTDGLFPYRRMIQIAKQICRGLKYAHSQNIIHRDIKSGNIMVADGDKVYITDFGIAQVANATRITTTGMTMGTPEYMAPEQCKGEEVDGQSDIYGLGIILYEMATGAPPFQADTPLAVAYKQVHETPSLLSKIRTDIPKRLELIVAKCLKKSRAERYASADELLADLDSVYAGTDSLPTPVAIPQSVPEKRITDRRGNERRHQKRDRSQGRNQLVSILSAAILSFFLGALLVTLAQNNTQNTGWLLPSVVTLTSQTPSIGDAAHGFDGNVRTSWRIPADLENREPIRLELEFEQKVLTRGIVMDLSALDGDTPISLDKVQITTESGQQALASWNPQMGTQFAEFPALWGQRFTLQLEPQHRETSIVIRNIQLQGYSYPPHK